MKLSRLTVVLYMLGVFVSGIVVGGFSYRLYTVSSVSAKSTARPTPEEYRKKFVAEMQSRLRLRQDQNKKMNEILDDTRSKFRATHDSIKPALQQIRRQQHESIAAMLDPDQRPEFEKILQERERRDKEQKEKERRP